MKVCKLWQLLKTHFLIDRNQLKSILVDFGRFQSKFLGVALCKFCLKILIIGFNGKPDSCDVSVKCPFTTSRDCL
jgi:hypothetical protein